MHYMYILFVIYTKNTAHLFSRVSVVVDLYLYVTVFLHNAKLCRMLSDA